ncbi:MAG: SprT family zinc-dependent metalloprotease [Gallionella sp.]
MGRKRNSETAALMFNRAPGRSELPGAERREATLAGEQISYTLKRRKGRRSIGLRIDDQGLTVSVPLRYSEQWLRDVLHDKADWVKSKLHDWKSRVVPEARWMTGEGIPYLGETLRLKVEHGLFSTQAYRSDKSLWVFVDSGEPMEGVKQSVMQWYRNEAERILAGRVAHFSTIMDVKAAGLRIAPTKSQWGSCTARGIVSLNLQLIKLSLRLVDYVVVHELAHLREMNHSAKFWNVVSAPCPDYARLRRELRTIAIGNF